MEATLLTVDARLRRLSVSQLPAAARLSEATALTALPLFLSHRILALLPVDARARCAAVCRAWRARLEDASLWTRLDLSRASGVACRVDDDVLRRIAARAQGALQTLNLEYGKLPCFPNFWPGDCHAELLAVVTANAGTLRELRLESDTRALLQGKLLRPQGLTQLLQAATSLRTLYAAVACTSEQALELVRNEPPYGPLRLLGLDLQHDHRTEDQRQRSDDLGDAGAARLMALAAALPSQASLQSLAICETRLESDAVCATLADASLTVRLTHLSVHGCRLSPVFVSALARVLRGNTLRELAVRDCGGLLDDVVSADVLAAALRANTSLSDLLFRSVAFWQPPHVPGTVLLEALVGHPSLCSLTFDDDLHPESAAAIGASLGALVAANAPSLWHLNAGSPLGDAGFGALCDALPHNTHLNCLELSSSRMSGSFAAERLLPAVRANTSLWKLTAPPYDRQLFARSGTATAG